MKMRQKLYIFKYLAKSKQLFFANIYHSSLDFHYAENIESPLPHNRKKTYILLSYSSSSMIKVILGSLKTLWKKQLQFILTVYRRIPQTSRHQLRAL